MFPSNFRIIPLLVLVAMLAFSFRIVEIVTGFSTLSGSALAVEEVNAEPPEMPPEAQSAKSPMKDESMVGVGGAGEAQPPEKEAPQLTFSEEDPEADDAHKEAAPVEKEKGGDIDWRDASDSDLDYTDVRMELFEDLSKRRKEIEQKEQETLTREALLRAAEKELDRKFQEMSQLRSEIEALLEKQSGEEENRVQSLVKIYEGMKPKDAARIFNTLDLDILVSVMGKMSERKLSPILASMNEERARTITIMLAEQKQLPSLLESN